MPFLKSLKRSSRTKIVVTALILGGVFAFFSGYLGYQHMGKMHEQRLDYLRQAVQLARSSIEPILVEYGKNGITKEEAIDEVRDLVRRMTYIDHYGNNYIFMSSYSGMMLVQPFEPEREMSYVWDLKDHNGKYIIRALVNAARSESGQGYVSYYYKRPGEVFAEEKISFVIGIPELECYIGTGQYMADIKKSQIFYITNITVLTFVLLLLLILLVRSSISEIELQNKMLRTTENELSAIFNNTFQLIGLLSVDGKLIKSNSTALKFINQNDSAVLGRYFWDTPWWTENEAKDELKRAVEESAKGNFYRFETCHTSFDGKKHFVDFSLSPVFGENGEVSSLLAEGRDISELKQITDDKKKLEEMLYQSQKMEAIGTLAGGVAHDFNNILTSIMGFAELVLADLSPDSPNREMQEQVIAAAVRAKELIQQILLFSRHSENQLTAVEPEIIIEDSLKLLRSSIPSTIEIRKNISSGLGTVLADPTHLHQVVMNLCTNSFHAMREKGGILKVSLYEKNFLQDDQMISDESLHAGEYLCLEISDTGQGIDQATLDKVFNPYFTTKPKGEGTGLGLSVVHGIVKNIGGEIKIESTPGVGTSVYIFFPKVQSRQALEPKRSSGELPTGTDNILLIDDDPIILKMTDISLSALGYHVTAYQDSREALEDFRKHSDRYDLVLTDMTMPHLTGLELSRQLFSINSAVPIILCTGYSDLIAREKAEGIGIKAFLTKPVRRERLASIIREVLSA